jgi:hypothetical protein
MVGPSELARHGSEPTVRLSPDTLLQLTPGVRARLDAI